MGVGEGKAYTQLEGVAGYAIEKSLGNRPPFWEIGNRLVLGGNFGFFGDFYKNFG